MKKYDYKVRSKIRHSGITKDLDRREQEHQQRWPGARIEQVGPLPKVPLKDGKGQRESQSLQSGE